MYFLVKNVRKANFVVPKYPVFFNFSPFFETFGALTPYDATSGYVKEI